MHVKETSANQTLVLYVVCYRYIILRILTCIQEQIIYDHSDTLSRTIEIRCVLLHEEIILPSFYDILKDTCQCVNEKQKQCLQNYRITS